jgi:predicted flap endonuclease-1-like 5' DNA nuclease
MLWFLGLFDPGWRDFSVRVSNTEITILWILAALLGALLYHFFLGKRGKVSADWEQKWQALDKEYHEEKNRHHKVKTQLDAALSKANSFAASANELEKFKVKVHDLQKELDLAKTLAGKYKQEFDAEHIKVTSMMVDHSEVEALRNRVKNQEKELQHARTENQKIKTELDVALSEKVRLSASMNESQVVELKQKLQRLENDLHSSRLMVVKYQTEANALEEARKRASGDTLTADDKSSETESLRNKLGQVETDLQKARQQLSELSNLRSQFEALKAEKEKWVNEAEVQAKNAASALSLQDRVSALEGEVVTLKEQKNKAIAELDAAQKEKNITSAAASEIQPLKDQLAVSLKSIAEMESKLASTLNALKVQEEKFAVLLAEKNKLAQELENVSIPVKPDNLKRIEGIGPKLEEMLNENNIFTFSQLSNATNAALQAILDEGGEAFRIHDPATWPEQAKLLSEGKIEEFEKLTLALKGGRRVE